MNRVDAKRLVGKTLLKVYDHRNEVELVTRDERFTLKVNGGDDVTKDITGKIGDIIGSPIHTIKEKWPNRHIKGGLNWGYWDIFTDKGMAVIGWCGEFEGRVELFQEDL